MMRIVLAFALSALTHSVWAEQAVKIHVTWKYKGFPASVSLYELKGKPVLWETQSVASLASAPVAQPIADSVLTLTPGQRKRFVLVVQNPGVQPLFFFAAPHTVHPEEDTLGFKFKCLCINHAYTINPKETWYRVVEFRLSRDFVGNELTISHTIIGIDSQRAHSFAQDAEMPDM